MLKPKPSLKLVICDWNGTLLNDLADVYKYVLVVFKTYNVSPPTIETYRQEITAHFMTFYHAHGIPTWVGPEDLNAIRTRYFEQNPNGVHLHRHVDELLTLFGQLGLFTGIVSAEVDRVLQRRLMQFEIARHFDAVIGNAWDKERALREMLDRFHFDPDEAAYIDDTHDGLTAAKNVGVLPIGVTHGYHSPGRIVSAQPDERYIARSFSHLKRIIEREVRNRNR